MLVDDIEKHRCRDLEGTFGGVFFISKQFLFKGTLSEATSFDIFERFGTVIQKKLLYRSPYNSFF